MAIMTVTQISLIRLRFLYQPKLSVGRFACIDKSLWIICFMVWLPVGCSDSHFLLPLQNDLIQLVTASFHFYVHQLVHVQSMHKSVTLILVFYGHSMQLCWKPILSPEPPLNIRCKVCCPWHASCLQSLARGHLPSLVPPSGIPYRLIIRNSLTETIFCSKLTCSALPMDSNDCPASICHFWTL